MNKTDFKPPKTHKNGKRIPLKDLPQKIKDNLKARYGEMPVEYEEKK